MVCGRNFLSKSDWDKYFVKQVSRVAQDVLLTQWWENSSYIWPAVFIFIQFMLDKNYTWKDINNKSVIKLLSSISLSVFSHFDQDIVELQRLYILAQFQERRKNIFPHVPWYYLSWVGSREQSIHLIQILEPTVAQLVQMFALIPRNPPKCKYHFTVTSGNKSDGRVTSFCLLFPNAFYGLFFFYQMDMRDKPERIEEMLHLVCQEFSHLVRRTAWHLSLAGWEQCTFGRWAGCRVKMESLWFTLLAYSRFGFIFSSSSLSGKSTHLGWPNPRPAWIPSPTS